MNNHIIVSLLIPIFNSEDYLERCLVSLLNQSYEYIEYVFVNDCSQDNSMAILNRVIKHYPHRSKNIKIVNNTINQGIAKTRNILLSLASGDYVMFVDSDDYVDRFMVETMLTLALRTNADIVRQNYYEVENNQVMRLVQNIPFTTKNELIEHTIVGIDGVEAMWLLFIKRSLFMNNHLNFIPDLTICEDWLMSIKLYVYAPIVVDTNQAFYYYEKGNNNSLTSKGIKINEYRMKAIDYLIEFLTSINLFHVYHKPIYARVIKCKQGYLLSKMKFNKDIYQNYYPQANSYWRYFKYGYREQILFTLAQYKLYNVIKFIYKVQSFFKQK